MIKKITFKQLALQSGVSIGTLSRYFNNGPVSEKNKKIIKQNIDKYSFVKNKAASKLRGANNQMIILRTVVRSNTLDNIIAGIVKHSDSDVVIKYSGVSETSVIKAIAQAITDQPKYLIVFAPVNVSKKFDEVVLKANSYSKIILYNYNVPNISSVNVSYQNAYKDLFLKYKKINFIYSDNQDVASYKNRISALRSSGIEVIVSNLINKDIPNFYQSNLLYNQLAYKSKSSAVLISYHKPIKYFDKINWIFVDQYYIGISIAKLTKLNKNKQIIVAAQFIEI